MLIEHFPTALKIQILPGDIIDFFFFFDQCKKAFENLTESVVLRLLLVHCGSKVLMLCQWFCLVAHR